jgi:glycosyltransferase involved in cell wall biosynthesis
VNVLLVDGDAPWVRALFAAMPTDVTVHAFRKRGPGSAARRPLDLLRGWHQTARGWWERNVLVPGWTKAPRLTARLWARALRRRLARLDDAVVVYTLPHYGCVAGRSPAVPQVYFAYDPYQAYTGWDPAVMAAGERDLLARCDAAFAISPALADDLRKLTDRPVFVQPNGVSESFLAEFARPLKPPDDLPLGGPPIVGCIGQISRAYDWDLLDGLATTCRELSFVFVGPVLPEGSEVQARIDRLLAQPNVRWLGPRPHADLPRYIQRFDVCLNPLRVEPCNDRRSLLRLYDYLASDRPIVSTAVAAALDHRPYVEVDRDAAGIAELLRRAAAGKIAVDREARRDYIRRHTWERRGELFLGNLRSVLAESPRR